MMACCSRNALSRTLLLSAANVLLFAQPAAAANDRASVPDSTPLHTRTALHGETLRGVLGDSPAERQFERSLTPYFSASERKGGSALTRLPTWVSGSRSAFSVGRDLIVLGTSAAPETLTVTLPRGHWVNFWTGAQNLGGTSFVADIPARTLAIWVRGGSVIQRRIGGPSMREGCYPMQPSDYPENCRETYLLDVMPPFSSEQPVIVKGDSDRLLTRTGDTLTIDGKPSRVTVRWRFLRVDHVLVNSTPVKLQNSADGYYINVDHAGHSTVTWAVPQQGLELVSR